MTTHATGRIEVRTWEETAYDEPEEGPKRVRVEVTETFTGDIAGAGRQRPRIGSCRDFDRRH